MRRLVGSFLAATLTAGLIAAGGATAQTPAISPGLPDLFAQRVERANIQAAWIDPNYRKLLLRFDGFIANRLGAGLLEIRGDTPLDGEMSHVVQIEHGEGTATTTHDLPGARLIYETSDGHTHWHLRAAARYSLWNSGGTAQVAPSNKIGFCLIDSEQGAGAPAARYTFGNDNCADGRPEAVDTHMGLTPGWRDSYHYALWWQWVEITDVQPGVYRLRAEVDPDDVVREIDDLNPPADELYTIPGYAAKPATLTGLSRSGPTVIELTSETFAASHPEIDAQGNATTPRTLSAPTYAIAEQPEHGTLEMVDATHVRYTPGPGAPGTDSFAFTARETGSGFPRSPARATVALTLQAAPPVERVEISGAPASLQTGSSADLDAAVLDGESTAVAWSVDGIAGGSDAVGRIDAAGVYVTPATAPPAGRVTIRATSTRGVFDETSIGITQAPPAAPIPSATGDVVGTGPVDSDPDTGAKPIETPRRKVSTFTSLGVRRSGRYAVATLTPRRSGRIRVTVFAGSKRLGSCRSRLLAGRAFTCRLRAGRTKGALRVVASYRDARGKVTRARYRARSSRAAHHPR